MKLAVFFMYLCSLLFGGATPAIAGTTYKDIDYTLTRYTRGKQEAKLIHAVRNSPEIRGIAPDTEIECFVTDDAEDDDSNQFLAKKMKLLARYPSAISYQSILSYLCNCFKAPPPFWAPVSYKYILQRALRI